MPTFSPFLPQPSRLLRPALAALAAFTTLAPTPSAWAQTATDPTSGDVVLLPGVFTPAPPPANTGTGASTGTNTGAREGAARPPAPGWYLPGRFLRSGEGWWALICQAKGCTLAPTQLNTFTVPGRAGQHLVWNPLPAGVAAAATTDAAPDIQPNNPLLMLFKPVRSLSALPLAAGPLPTWLHRGMGRYPRPDWQGTQDISIPTPGGAARLRPRLIQATPPDAGPALLNWPQRRQQVVWELQLAGQSQILPFEWSLSTLDALDPNRSLAWAGDLDGDGKLDLLLSLRTSGSSNNSTSAGGNAGGGSSGGVWQQQLLLSSLAQPGELLGLAGSFRLPIAPTAADAKFTTRPLPTPLLTPLLTPAPQPAGSALGRQVWLRPETAQAWWQDAPSSENHSNTEGRANTPTPLHALPRLKRERRQAVLRVLTDGRIVVAGGFVQSELISVLNPSCTQDCPDDYIGFGPQLPARRHEWFDPSIQQWRSSEPSRAAGSSAVVLADGSVVKLGFLPAAPQGKPGGAPAAWLIERSSPSGLVWTSLPAPAGADLPLASLQLGADAQGVEQLQLRDRPASAASGTPAREGDEAHLWAWQAASQSWVALLGDGQP